MVLYYCASLMLRLTLRSLCFRFGLTEERVGIELHEGAHQSKHVDHIEDYRVPFRPPTCNENPVEFSRNIQVQMFKFFCRAMKTKGMVFRYTWVYSKEDTMVHT